MELTKDLGTASALIAPLDWLMVHITSPFYSMRWAVIAALEREHRV